MAKPNLTIDATADRRMITGLVECRRAAGAGARGRGAGSDANGSELVGYGALFNDETVIAGMFRERIAPGAFKDSLAEDDIRVAFNHNMDQILGRTSAGTATITEDRKGLLYRVQPPDTSFGRDILVSVKRGDVTGSSFQFTIDSDEDEEWDFGPVKKGLLPLRTIKRVRLMETGPVAFPAYENTTVSARTAQRLAALGRASGSRGPHENELLLLELDLLEMDIGATTPAPRRRYSPGPVGHVERELDALDREIAALNYGR